MNSQDFDVWTLNLFTLEYFINFATHYRESRKPNPWTINTIATTPKLKRSIFCLVEFSYRTNISSSYSETHVKLKGKNIHAHRKKSLLVCSAFFQLGFENESYTHKFFTQNSETVFEKRFSSPRRTKNQHERYLSSYNFMTLLLSFLI